MVIQLIYQNETYNLPKYTFAIMDAMTEINNETDSRIKAELMYKFVSSAIGDKQAKDIIGKTLDDADLINLRTLYASIDKAYADAMRAEDPQADKMEDVVATIEKLGGMENVIALLNAVNANK